MTDPRLILHELTDLELSDGYDAVPDERYLKHLMAGYRDWLINGNLTSPFDPDSVEDRSWRAGIELARADMPLFAVFADDRPSEEGTDGGIVVTTGTLVPSNTEPDVMMTQALVKNAEKVIGGEVGQFLYHGTTCAEVLEKDGLRRKLTGIGWVWLRHTRLKP